MLNKSIYLSIEHLKVAICGDSTQFACPPLRGHNQTPGQGRIFFLIGENIGKPKTQDVNPMLA